MLTDLEGHLLAQLVRQPGTTAYDAMRVLATQAITGVSASPGAIYPAVKRLRQRGFVDSQKSQTGARQHELLTASEAGVEALRTWVGNVTESDLLPYDPLRVKLLYFDLLTPEQRVAWLERLRSALALAERLLPDAAEAGASEAADIAASGARRAVKHRLALVDRIRQSVATGTT